jgi:hypothetical protein
MGANNCNVPKILTVIGRCLDTPLIDLAVRAARCVCRQQPR